MSTQPPDQSPPAYSAGLPPATPEPPAQTAGPPGPPPGGFRPPPNTVPPAQPAGPYAGPGQPPYPPRRTGGGSPCLVIGIIVVVCVVGLFAVMMMFGLKQGGGSQTTWPGATGDSVGVIRISGIIMGGGGVSPFFGAAAGSESVTSQFRRAAKDDTVKALVVRINSPGGSAAASQEIYQAIREYRKETKRPVVASMGDVAASGGYYCAAACDKIVAAPATMTGSIGVIIETIEYEGLMTRFGVKGDAITSGRYKDMGSAFRKMRPDERQVFQAMVDDVYDQFVEAVAEGRGMRKEQVKRLADGRAYTGRQAKKVRLVDDLGTFRDAIRIAGQEGKIKGEPTVKFFESRTLFGALFGEVDAIAPQHVPPGLLFDRRLWPVQGFGLEAVLAGDGGPGVR